MIGLLIACFAGAVLVLYAGDRVFKARAQTRKLRMMNDRLAAAVTRGEEQQEQRQAAAEASAELTSFMPAISSPPLTPPGARKGRRAGPRRPVS
jgi:hypothetical protein